jgi:glycosyltransferase involved in cell wall biosynthesis
MANVKRLNLLIEACAQAEVSRLTLIGDGPQREHLEALARSLSLALSVIPRVDQSELPQLLSEHDAFALVSEVEGHPKALIEAMSLPMPVIVTSSPGLVELVENGMTGLVATASPQAVALALRAVLGSPELADQLSVAAGSAIRKRFGVGAIVAEEIAVVERLADKTS